MKKFTISLLFLLAVTAVNVVLAQAPNQFKYQAVLRDASGNIIPNTAEALLIDILQGSSSGTIVYEETQNVTTTAQGILNLNIGGGTPVSGNFATISWGTNTYWVKITIGSTVISNGQLLSVPYALNAASSSSSQWLNGSSGAIYYSSGNIGAGITAPTNLLHLKGTTDRLGMTIESNAPGFGPEIHLTSTATSGHEWRIVSGASASNSYGVGSFELWDQTAGASRFGILPNGNVGIGTVTPAAKLEVNGGLRVSNNNDLQLVAASGFPYDPGDVAFFNYDGTQRGRIWMDQASSTGGLQFVATNSGLAQMYLTHGGNLGIGTLTPTAKLDVEGTVKIADGTQGAGKVLSSGADGTASWVTNTAITPAVTAVLSSNPWTWTTAAPAWTGSTLTLPPGKWSVQISILLSHTSGLECWVRSTFTDGSGISSSSPDIIGASLASGYKALNSWGMLIGTIIINNTGASKTYYFWGQNCETYQGSFTLYNFGTSLSLENQIIAYPMN